MGVDFSYMVADLFVGLIFLLAILLMRLELMTNTLKANLKEKKERQRQSNLLLRTKKKRKKKKKKRRKKSLKQD